MAMLCNGCNKQKEDVTSIKTYNGKFVNACPECKESMKKILILLKSSDWVRKVDEWLP